MKGGWWQSLGAGAAGSPPYESHLAKSAAAATKNCPFPESSLLQAPWVGMRLFCMHNLLLIFLSVDPQARDGGWLGFFHRSARPLHVHSCGIPLFSSTQALNNQDFQGRSRHHWWHHSKPFPPFVHIGIDIANTMVLFFKVH